MLSYTGRRNLFGDIVGSSVSATLTLADTLMNTSEKRILTQKNWPFLEKQYTLTTEASVADYKLHPYTRKPESVYITVSSQRYTPREVATRKEWDELNQTTVTSDSVTHYFVYDGQISFFPRPATADNTITLNARRVAKDLKIADYTTGNISTVSTTGTTTTVTGAGGATWHTGMIGRWIRITNGDAANTLSGDHIWYEIATVPTSSTLTLVRTYGGTAIAAASAAYTIAEISLLPEPFDQIPLFEALETYYTSPALGGDSDMAQLYGGKAKELFGQMVRDFGSQSQVVLDSGGEEEFSNPNLHITL